MFDVGDLGALLTLDAAAYIEQADAAIAKNVELQASMERLQATTLENAGGGNTGMSEQSLADAAAKNEDTASTERLIAANQELNGTTTETAGSMERLVTTTDAAGQAATATGDEVNTLAKMFLQQGLSTDEATSALENYGYKTKEAAGLVADAAESLGIESGAATSAAVEMNTLAEAKDRVAIANQQVVETAEPAAVGLGNEAAAAATAAANMGILQEDLAAGAARQTEIAAASGELAVSNTALGVSAGEAAAGMTAQSAAAAGLAPAIGADAAAAQAEAEAWLLDQGAKLSDIEATDGLAAAHIRLGQGIAGVRGGMSEEVSGLGLVALAVAAVGAAAIDEAAKWESSMQKIQANTTMTTQQTQQMSDTVMRMAQTTSVPLDDLAQGYMRLTNLGYDAASATTILDAAQKLAARTHADAAVTINTVGVALHDYNAPASQATQYTNELQRAVQISNTTLQDYQKPLLTLLPLASSLGISFGDLTAAISATTAEGIPAGRVFSALQTTMERMAAPTAAQTVELEKLGKAVGVDLVSEWSASNLAAGGFQKAVMDTNAALTATNTNVETLEPNMRGLLGGITILGQGNKEWAADQQSIVAAGKNTNQFMVDQQQQADTLGARLGELGNAAKIAAIGLGSILEPIAKISVSGLANTIESWIGGLKSTSAASALAVAAMDGTALSAGKEGEAIKLLVTSKSNDAEADKKIADFLGELNGQTDKFTSSTTAAQNAAERHATSMDADAEATAKAASSTSAASQAHDDLGKALGVTKTEVDGLVPSFQDLVRYINDVATSADQASDALVKALSKPTVEELKANAAISDLNAKILEMKATIGDTSPEEQEVAALQHTYDSALTAGKGASTVAKAKGELDAALANTGPSGQYVASLQQQVDANTEAMTADQNHEKATRAGIQAAIDMAKAQNGGTLTLEQANQAIADYTAKLAGIPPATQAVGAAATDMGGKLDEQGRFIQGTSDKINAMGKDTNTAAADVKTGAQTATDGLADLAQKGGEQITNFKDTTIGALEATRTAVATEAYSIGANIASGVENGIMDGSGAVAGAAAGMVAGAIAAANAAAGNPHSPAPATIPLGMALGQGMAVGVDQSAPLGAQAANNWIDGMASVLGAGSTKVGAAADKSALAAEKAADRVATAAENAAIREAKAAQTAENQQATSLADLQRVQDDYSKDYEDFQQNLATKSKVSTQATIQALEDKAAAYRDNAATTLTIMNAEEIQIAAASAAGQDAEVVNLKKGFDANQTLYASDLTEYKRLITDKTNALKDWSLADLETTQAIAQQDTSTADAVNTVADAHTALIDKLGIAKTAADDANTKYRETVDLLKNIDTNADEAGTALANMFSKPSTEEVQLKAQIADVNAQIAAYKAGTVGSTAGIDQQIASLKAQSQALGDSSTRLGDARTALSASNTAYKDNTEGIKGNTVANDAHAVAARNGSLAIQEQSQGLKDAKKSVDDQISSLETYKKTLTDVPPALKAQLDSLTAQRDALQASRDAMTANTDAQTGQTVSIGQMQTAYGMLPGVINRASGATEQATASFQSGVTILKGIWEQLPTDAQDALGKLQGLINADVAKANADLQRGVKDGVVTAGDEFAKLPDDEQTALAAVGVNASNAGLLFGQTMAAGILGSAPVATGAMANTITGGVAAIAPQTQAAGQKIGGDIVSHTANTITGGAPQVSASVSTVVDTAASGAAASAQTSGAAVGKDTGQGIGQGIKDSDDYILQSMQWLQNQVQPWMATEGAAIGKSFDDGIADAISGNIGEIQDAAMAAGRAAVAGFAAASGGAGLTASIGAGATGSSMANAQVPMLADGGIATKETLAVLAENGPEAVIPLDLLNGLLTGTGKTVGMGIPTSTITSGSSGGNNDNSDIQKAVTMLSSTVEAGLSDTQSAVNLVGSNVRETTQAVTQITAPLSDIQTNIAQLPEAITSPVVDAVDSSGTRVATTVENSISSLGVMLAPIVGYYQQNAQYAMTAQSLGATQAFNQSFGGGNTAGQNSFATLEHTLGVPGFAGGAIVTVPQLAMVGEAGSEAIVPLTEMPSLIASSLSAALSGAASSTTQSQPATITVNFTIGSKTFTQQVLADLSTGSTLDVHIP